MCFLLSDLPSHFTIQPLDHISCTDGHLDTQSREVGCAEASPISVACAAMSEPGYDAAVLVVATMMQQL